MKVKLKSLETELVKEQETVSQLQLTLQAEASESQELKRVQSVQGNTHLHSFVP